MTPFSLSRRIEYALRVDSRLWVALLYASVAIGLLFRVLRWIDNPSLWLDEAFLSINLTEKSFGDIFGPLQFLQSAPPGFLLLEKLSEMTLGDAEWSLRLFPLLTSLVSVVLFALIARRMLAAPAAALAAGLFATAEPLLLRAAEVKHYSVDVAVVTLLVLLYLWAMDARDHTSRRLVILGFAASICLFFSFVAAFTIAAIVAALTIRSWEAGSRRLALQGAITAGVTLVTFALVYTIAARNLDRVGASIIGGDDAGLSVGRLKTIDNAWWTFINPGGFENETNSLAALLAGFALVALARRGSLDRLVLFALPFALAALADVLGRYPLGGRFSMFLVPSLIIVVARGAQALVGWSRRGVLVGTGIALFLLASPVAIAAYHALAPPARADVTPLLKHLVREWRRGDALYVYPNTQFQLRYYATCEDCSLSGVDFPWPTRLALPTLDYGPALESVPPSLIVGTIDDPEGPLADLDRLPKGGRTWMFFSHIDGHEGLDEMALLVSVLEREATLREDVRARGARLFLFEDAAP